MGTILENMALPWAYMIHTSLVCEGTKEELRYSSNPICFF